MLRQLIFHDNTTKVAAEKADTDSTASCDSNVAETKLQIQVEDEESLQQVWNELKLGAYQQAKRIEVVFHPTDAHRKLSKLRRLDNVFGALGALPLLEEVVFIKSDLLFSSLVKLLKKSSLKKVKFQQCTLIAKKLEHTERLWAGLATQQSLTTLEILDCQYTDSDTLCRNRVPFTYNFPKFLLNNNNTIERLVLDTCQLTPTDFTTLLNNGLQELELCPVWQLPSNTPRRQQYQTKKRVIREFLCDVIPNALAHNTTLTTLVVSLEDYHLEQVFVETMTEWIDLVQHENSTVRELRVTHRPLSESASQEPDWYAAQAPEDYAESYLHYNLRSILRLNQMFQSKLEHMKQESEEETDEESVEEEEIDVVEEEQQQRPQQQQQQSPVTEIWV